MVASTIVRDDSLLAIVQAVCSESGVTDAPSSVITNTDRTIQQVLSFTISMARKMRDKFPWKKLHAEHTFDLVDSQASYAQPANFNWELAETHWNQDTAWRILGPMSPAEWQEDKSGLVEPTTNQMYRIKGLTNSRFFITPTPTSSEAGQTCVYEYLSLNCWRPVTWTQSTAFAAASFCFYDGVIYETTAGGTTNGTSPADDVGIGDWTVYTGAYDYPRADTDIFVLGAEDLQMGVKGMLKRERRLEGYLEDLMQYETEISARYGREAGEEPIDIGRPAVLWPNVADTGIMSYEE